MSKSLTEPKNTIFENQFNEAIMDSLQNYHYQNSIFLAERLYSLSPSEKTKKILGELYIQNSNYYNSYNLLKDSKDVRGRYLYSLSCYHINKFEKARDALLNDKRPKDLNYVVNGANGIFLLGKIYEKLLKREKACECYLEAYKKNPLLFKSLEKFMKLSPKLKKEKIERLVEIYKIKGTLDFGLTDVNHSVFRNYEEITKIQKENAIFNDYSQNKNIKEALKNKNLKTSNKKKMPYKLDQIKKLSSSKKIDNKKKQKLNLIPKMISKQQKTIYHILSSLAKPLVLLLNDDHNESLELFKNLNKPFKNDPWVLINIGRCYTEFSKHKSAEIYFKEAYSIDKNRINGIEYYSSCLWHLKKIPELSQLAYSCLEKHYFRPETWIALGNCYSANEDHETAIKFLERAIQLDPTNAYAYCLVGHEHSTKENYEDSKIYYEKAINYDPSNVRAYWGLGLIHSKTEKYSKAIDYFTIAIQINSSIATIYTQLAIAHLNQQEFELGFIYIKKAEELSPKDTYTWYYKSLLLFKLKRNQEALREILKLLEDEKKESLIFILLGDVYKAIGKKNEAHNAYLQANHLDPKNGQKIKAMIENLNEGGY